MNAMSPTTSMKLEKDFSQRKRKSWKVGMSNSIEDVNGVGMERASKKSKNNHFNASKEQNKWTDSRDQSEILFEYLNVERCEESDECRETGYCEQELIERCQNLNRMGVNVAKRGMWKCALDMWLEEKDIRDKYLSDDQIKIANNLNDIGIALGKLNYVNEAMKHFHKALALRRTKLGNDHLDVAATIHNMGNIELKKSCFASAIEYFSEALRIKVKTLGYVHVDVAITIQVIGHIQNELCQFGEAWEAFNRCLGILKHAGLGDDHEYVVHVTRDIMNVRSLMNL